MGVLHKDLEAQRQKLIEILSAYKKGKAHEITVVFDGWKSGGPTETRTVQGGVEVVYSRLGEKADAVIKRMLTSQRQHIVITSDRDIQAYAWANDSVPLDSGDFLHALEQGSGAQAEDEPLPAKGKGSSRPLSKKSRAKKRALDKL
ncbi:MAG: NYN domain-containing protein [Thermodesulfovibrionales bacterium]|nr:NYN domain-containing protein [Thermodesulfovibrionales bacterium]